MTWPEADAVGDRVWERSIHTKDDTERQHCTEYLQIDATVTVLLLKFRANTEADDDG